MGQYNNLPLKTLQLSSKCLSIKLRFYIKKNARFLIFDCVFSLLPTHCYNSIRYIIYIYNVVLRMKPLQSEKTLRDSYVIRCTKIILRNKRIIFLHWQSTFKAFNSGRPILVTSYFLPTVLRNKHEKIATGF